MRLLDETAIMACAAYVDLNPIRAAMAETIEESEFTSAQKRAAGIRREYSVGSFQFSVNAHRDSAGDGVRSSLLLQPEQAASMADKAPSAERGVYGTGGGVRYLATVELNERLGVSGEIWCLQVKDFGKLLSVVAGQLQRIVNHSSKTPKSAHRFRIRRAARELMASGSAAGC